MAFIAFSRKNVRIVEGSMLGNHVENINCFDHVENVSIDNKYYLSTNRLISD